MKKTFRRHWQALDHIFEFVNEFSDFQHLSESEKYAVNLIVEELFSNFVKYDGDNPSDIELGLVKTDQDLIISVVTMDIEPFDITAGHSYNTRSPLEERPVGKLGLHLVKSMVDQIRYEHQERKSRIILIRHLRRKHV